MEASREGVTEMATQFPPWSWVDVVTDHRDTNGRNFLYSYHCPGCGDVETIHSADVPAHNEHTGGRCVRCHTANVVPDFWEVMEPIERFTVAQRDGASWVVRVYRFAAHSDLIHPDVTREMFRAVVTGSRDDAYITVANAQPYYAITDALGYVTRRALKVTKADT